MIFKKLGWLVCGFLVGCGSSVYQDFPESEYLKASIEALRLESEVTLKMQTCYAYEAGFGAGHIEPREFEQAFDYYRGNARKFNRKIKNYVEEYGNDVRTDPELSERFFELIFQEVRLKARLQTAKYFHVDSKEVVEALNEPNELNYLSNYNPNTQIILDAIEQQEQNIDDECEEFLETIYETGYMPDLDEYAKEYQHIVGRKIYHDLARSHDK